MKKIEIKKSELIDIELIDFDETDPNEMSDYKFNQLVKRIQEEGFKDPIRVYPKPDGRYKTYGGKHRVKAMQVLNQDKIPAFIEKGINQDQAKLEMIKDNVIRGKMNIQKFTAFYDSLSKKYEREAIREMLALEPKELDMWVKHALESLPDELKHKLEEAKGEIKNIEDLSTILNKLFNEYGDTLQYHFMIVDFNGKKHLWIQCSEANWKKLEEIRSYCSTNGKDINIILNELLENYQADTSPKGGVTE